MRRLTWIAWGIWVALDIEEFFASGWNRPPLVPGQWLFWAPALWFVVFGVVVAVQRHRWRDFIAGGRSLLAGRPNEALAHFQLADAKFPNERVIDGAMAVAMLRAWRPAEARQRPAAVEPTGTSRRERVDRDVVLAYRALASALLGDLDDARTTYARAKALGAAEVVQTRLASLVLASRAGDWVYVETGTDVSELIGKLAGADQALAQTLVAWSVAAQGRPAPSVPVSTLLGDSTPLQIREVWPELADFVETRN